MGMHILPLFESYWSRDSLLDIPSLSWYMSRARFRQLLCHLHLYTKPDVMTQPKKLFLQGKADRTHSAADFSASLQPKPGVLGRQDDDKCFALSVQISIHTDNEVYNGFKLYVNNARSQGLHNSPRG